MKRLFCFLAVLFISVQVLGATGSFDEHFALNRALGNPAEIPAYHIGNVRTLAVSPSGKRIYLGGMFTHFAGEKIGSHIVAVNEKGERIKSFDTGEGLKSPPYSIVVDPDEEGTIYVAGAFMTYNRGPAPRIAKILKDGSADPSFNIGSGPNTEPLSLYYDPTLKQLYVLGFFQEFGHNPYQGIVRLKRDGSVDESFKLDPEIAESERLPRSAYLYMSTRKMIPSLKHPGKYYLSYSLADGINADRHRVVRISKDGKWDKTFKMDVQYDREAEGLAEAPDGKIYLGGTFLYLASSGTRGAYIFRVKDDGSWDKDFIVNAGERFVNAFDLMIPSDGVGVYFAGGYTSYPPAFNFGKFLDDGSLDPNFTTGDGSKGDVIFQMAASGDGQLYMGGYLKQFDGHELSGAYRLNVGK